MVDPSILVPCSCVSALNFHIDACLRGCIRVCARASVGLCLACVLACVCCVRVRACACRCLLVGWWRCACLFVCVRGWRAFGVSVWVWVLRVLLFVFILWITSSARPFAMRARCLELGLGSMARSALS